MCLLSSFLFWNVKQKPYTHTKMRKFKVNYLSFTVLENWNYPSNCAFIGASYWNYYLPTNWKYRLKTFLHLESTFLGVIPTSKTYISCSCKTSHRNPGKYFPALVFFNYLKVSRLQEALMKWLCLSLWPHFSLSLQVYPNSSCVELFELS